MGCDGAPVRLLLVGNAPWSPSGYGEQIALFLPRLQALGHDVALMATHGLQGSRFEWNGVTVYPSDNQLGNRVMMTYAKDFQADQIIVLHDAWPLTPDAWDDGPPVAIWTPIDHYPIPPAVLAVLSHERVQPIAMSRFGEGLMDAFNLEPLYVPHGVDTNRFYPRPEIRDAVRAELGIPADAFLVGMVSANGGNPATDRKGFGPAFMAFAQFAKDHPDAWMYVHTRAEPLPSGGQHLDVLARATGCPSDRLAFPNQAALDLGMGHDVVAALYQAFDVLLMPSMGEGFGIPNIEAQASGCPVIASDHSAMTELTAGTGWLIEGQPFWDDLQQSFFFTPFIASVHACLTDAYENRGDREVLSTAAVEFAQAYDADRVTQEFWVPVLAKLAGEEPAPVSRQVRRAQERKRAKVAV